MINKKIFRKKKDLFSDYWGLFFFFFLLQLAPSSLYAQETISFDDQGFNACDILDDNHNFSAIGKNFRIFAANFDGTPSSGGSLWYESAAGDCWHSYPTEMEDGGYITAGYTSDINFQWYHPQALVMKTADGSNFKFVSFKAHDAEWSSWGNYLKISGYQDGVLQGSESVVIVSHMEPYHSTVTLTDPIFEDVDEVRITMDKDNNPDFGNPGIIHSDADGLYHSFDTFVVGAAAASAPLSSSPTISFSSNTGFGDNIAQDGEGGSVSVSDINIQIYPINSSAVKLTDDPLQYHDSGDWPGYPAIITYGDINPLYGWVIKSDDGDDFSLVKIDFHDWGGWTGDTFVAEAFLDGSSKGAISFTGNTDGNYVELANPGALTSIFGKVDEVRLYLQGGANSYISLNNIQVSTAESNVAPMFNDGASTTLSVTQNDPATAINNLLDISDSDSGDGLTWSVSSGPDNGTLAGFPYATTSNGSSVTPSGLTYQPDNGYNGSDNFTIQISDGTDTDEITVNVTVNGFAPIADENYDDDVLGTNFNTTPSSKTFYNDGIIYEITGTNNYTHGIRNNGFLGSGSDHSLIFDTGGQAFISSIKLSSATGDPFSLKGLVLDGIADNNITVSAGGSNDVLIASNGLAVTETVDVSGNSDFYNITSFTISGGNIVLEIDDIDVGAALSNSAPTASGIPSDITVTEDVASNTDLSGITFADADGDALTVTLSASAGTLNSSSGGGVTIGGSGTGALTLAGTAANINTFLDTPANIKYTGASNANGNNAATLTINANDGTVNPQLGTVNIDITAVNDAPSVTGLPSDITVTEDVASNVDLSSSTFADVDGDALTVTIAASSGTLAAASGGGVTVSGSGTGTMTLAGTAANINTYLNTASNIRYTGASNANGNNTATLAINVGDGAVNPQLGTVNIDITAVNDAPVASNVTFTGTLEVGRQLTGSYDYSDVESAPENGTAFKWHRYDASSGSTGKTQIGTGSTYTLAAADENKYISFEVTPNDGTDAGAPVESARQGPVTDPAPDINLKGNNVAIVNGDNTPSTTDHTDFGSEAAASGTISRTFTVENTGSLGLTLIDDDGRGYVSVSGANAGDFTVTEQPNENTGAAGSTTFVIEFDPSAIGERTGTVNISSNDPDENPYSFSIKGTGSNTDPVITSSATANVDENTTAVMTVTATDADSHTLSFSISGGADAALFSIDASSGALTFDSAPDFENPADNGANNVYEVEVTVSDGNSGVDVQSIAVTVNDENDNSPTFASSNTADVDENTKAVLTVNATDADAASTISYSIIGGDDQALFSINGTSGALSFDSAPDHENPADSNTDNDYVVQVRASDGTHTTDQTITVSVQDVNDNSPAISSTNTASMNENSTAAKTVTATDADATSSITYSITGGADQGLFSIGITSGALTFDSAPDAENPSDSDTNNEYEVEVTASDGTHTDVQTITITVNDVNDIDPAITASQSFNIDENSADGTNVGTVAATDGDATATTFQSWSITGGNTGGAFAINSSTGEITVATAGAIDREATASFTLRITVSDGVNTSAAENIAIDVNDVNDVTPVVTASQSFNIDENSANAASLGTITATDGDVTATVFQTWTITGGNTDGAFAINASTGELTVANTSALDREITASFTLQVTVSDGVNASAAGNVAIDLNDVNDNNPVFQNTPYTSSVVENAAIGSSVFTVEATDADAGANGQVQYSISGGNTNNDLTINSVTGEITTANALDRNLTASYSLQVTATDQGTGNLTDVAIVEITVNDVNDNAPVIQNEPYSASLNEDLATGETVATILATDADEGINAEVEYSITNGNTEGKFAIDANTGAITIAQALDYEITQSYAIEVTASDKGTPSLTDVTTVAINVNDVNDNAPDFQGEPYATDLPEDAGAGTAVLTISATDDDSGVNAQVSYHIVGGDPSGQFAIDAVTGEITTVKTLDRETIPAYSLEIIAADGGTPGWNSNSVVEITITDINDNAPVFTGIPYIAEINEAATAGTAVFTVKATDADEGANADVQYSIAEGNTNGAFAIDANSGEITVNSALDRETLDAYSLQITATDQGTGNLSATATVSVAVTDANDHAPLAGDDSYETNEDETLQIAAAGVLANDSDEDLNTVLTATIVDQPQHGALTLNADGSFTYTPDADYNGSDSFTYQANDGNATSNTATVSLTVNAVNDAPTVSTPADQEIAINTAIEPISFTINDIDSDINLLEVTVISGNTVLLPASGINLTGAGANRQLTLTPATDETGTTQTTITVSDGDKEMTASFTLTVYPVNVAPEDIMLSENTFIESIEPDEEIGVFSTADKNVDDFHVYSLVSGEGDDHNNLFVIEGDKLITNGDYDYESESVLTIRVRTTDRWGEVFEKTFELKLIANPELELHIPTAFTPNFDGNNDTWKINNISLHPKAIVKVYNRNGQVLFSSVGYETPWDGRYKGKDLPFGTYYFVIDLNDSKSRSYKGTVMILY